MLPNKKHAVALILGMNKPGEAPSPPKEDNDELVGRAQDVLHALEAKDPVMLADSLHSFFQLCDASPHEEYEE